MDLIGASHGGDGERIEERVVDHGEAELFQSRRENAGQAVHARGDGREPVGAVVDRIHRRDDGKQHLCGADVRGRLLAPDVLLARLQGEPVRRLAVGVYGHADQAPRKVALELVPRGEKRGVRAAEAHRHAEALGRTDNYIRAPFTRWGEQRQREQVGGHQHQRTARVQCFDERTIVAHIATGARILQHRGEAVGIAGGRRGTDHDRQS